MIELPISIVAWLTVVIVQAVIHFIVFGARRERLQKEEEAMFETLSLSTSESFTDFDAATSSVEQMTPRAYNGFENRMVAAAAVAAAASSSSSLLDVEDEDEEDDIIWLDRATAAAAATDASDALNNSFSSSAMLLEDDDDLIVQPSPYYLMQTGKDIFRVRFVLRLWYNRI